MSCPGNAVCGETRVAIGIWLLGGGSYLDMLGLCGYGVGSPSSLYRYFHTFTEWIDNSFECLLVNILMRLKKGDKTVKAELLEISQ